MIVLRNINNLRNKLMSANSQKYYLKKNLFDQKNIDVFKIYKKK